MANAGYAGFGTRHAVVVVAAILAAVGRQAAHLATAVSRRRTADVCDAGRFQAGAWLGTVVYIATPARGGAAIRVLTASLSTGTRTRCFTVARVADLFGAEIAVVKAIGILNAVGNDACR